MNKYEIKWVIISVPEKCCRKPKGGKSVTLIGDSSERMTVEMGLQGKSSPLTRVSGGKDNDMKQHKSPLSLRAFAHLSKIRQVSDQQQDLILNGIKSSF